jgi:hypothetical protein
MLVILYFPSKSILEKLKNFTDAHKSTLDNLRQDNKEGVKDALEKFHIAQQKLEKCLPDEAPALFGRWFRKSVQSAEMPVSTAAEPISPMKISKNSRMLSGK